MVGHFHVGPWLVQPDLNTIALNGNAIRLTPKVMGVLTCLAQQPGALVSKEKLIQTVWPDTYVTEDVLKGAISELRRAFEDDAREPRFIETIPKRGYRLIARVRRDDVSSIGVSVAREKPRIFARSRNRMLNAALSGLLILATGGLLWRWLQPRRLEAKDTVVLGDFVNSTGDSVFDSTLRQGLAVQLEQSPFLKLLSDEQIHQTLQMMGQRGNAQLTPEITHEICQRTNSAAAITGSIALIGSRYDVILRAVDCASENLLTSAEAQARDKSHVLDAVSSVASQMRRNLGESLGTVQKYNTPLAKATTPSLEALQAYSLGLRTIRQTGDYAEALSSYNRAVELDPNFAMAYLHLADTYNIVGESALAAESIRKAFALRGGVSELERLLIDGDYHYFATGDLLKARRNFELSVKMYPSNDYAHNLLADLSSTLGQHESALKEYLEALRVAPLNSILYRHVAFTYLLLNRDGEAAAIAKEAHAKGLDSKLGPVLYAIAFYQNNSAEMTRQVASSAGKAGEEDLLLGLEADTAAYFGHFRKAQELSRRAADSAVRAGEKEAAAGYNAVSVLCEALYGSMSKARKTPTGKDHLVGRDLDYAAALALAYAGDINRAQTLTDDLAKKFPEDTVVQFNYLPTLRAKLALSHSNPNEALDAIEIAAPYELGLPSYSFYNWPNLYPVYVHGEAYLAARMGREAATEFQKILDHRGIVLNEPIGVLAHLQIGRAYAMTGDTYKARAAYQDFFALWKNADPDIPILKQANAEYTKLH